MLRDQDKTRWVFETPTVMLALAVHGLWLAVTTWHDALPLPLLIAAGGVIVAWHGSLQHETIHGHPTGIGWIDAAIGGVPLSLWLPYSIYRRTHIGHHATPNITDPLDDPESQYLKRPIGLRYRLARLEATFIGRLILGPPIRIGDFLLAQLSRAMHDPKAAGRDWALHLLSVGVLLWWLHRVDLPIGTYLLAFVYSGTAITLLRSFAEHRADPDSLARAAIILRPGPFGLLFLNNNLHAVHHARPDLPWYRLPSFHRRHGQTFAAAPHYANYGQVVARFWFKSHDSLIHPDYVQARA
jgi:fatty acid desaturase